MNYKDTLEQLGIEYREEPKYYIQCPMCSNNRSKKGSKSLKVYQNEMIVGWQCHHYGQCKWNKFTTLSKSGDSKPKLDTEYTKVFIPKDIECPIKEGIKYHYYDKDSNLCMIIVRTEDKRFLPLTYTDRDEFVLEAWAGKLLYKGEKIKESGPIIVVEGEKAADAAEKIFTNASVVTWAGGANGFRRGDWDLLKDREVVLWADNDIAGKKCMAELAHIIPTNNVSIMDVSSLPEKADAADIDDKNVISELYKSREQVIKKGMLVTISPEDFLDKVSKMEKGLPLGWSHMDDKIRYPQSGLVVIGGRSGHGKTSLMINMAVNILNTTDRKVVYYSYEMPAERVLLKFLMAMEGVEKARNPSDNEEAYRQSVLNSELKSWELLQSKMQSQFYLTDHNDDLSTLVKTLDSERFEGAIVYVDYIQIIPVEESRNRYLGIKKAADDLRAIANRRNMVIVTGSQLTDGETPYQDTVREGKDITNAAELEIKVWNKVAAEARGAYKTKKDKETKEEVMEAYYDDVMGNFAVQIVKNRNGDVGDKFGFDLKFGAKLEPKIPDEKFKNF